MQAGTVAGEIITGRSAASQAGMAIEARFENDARKNRTPGGCRALLSARVWLMQTPEKIAENHRDLALFDPAGVAWSQSFVISIGFVDLNSNGQT